jgi:hypothetical protein
MRLISWALPLALAATLAGARAWGWSVPLLLVFLALPLVMFLPGLAIIRFALNPAPFRLEHILLACGLSVAITILGGLALHVLGALTPTGWATLLGGITAAFAVAAPRRVGSVGGVGTEPGTNRKDTWRYDRLAANSVPSLSRRQAAMFACAAVIAAGAFLVARQGAMAHKEFPATEFWMVPELGCCPNALTLGIRNLEDDTVEYDVEITLEGQVVGAFRSIELRPGEEWISDANLPFRPGSGRRAEARLFKNHDHSLIYRRVWADIGRV